MRSWLAGPVGAAALLAVALVVVATLAARALRERDDAVRRGELATLTHELELDLREAGPALAAQAMAEFCAQRRGELARAELVGPAGVLASCGEASSSPAFEAPMALGRDWRGLAGGPGFGPGRGAGGRVHLRLYPTAELGRASTLARTVVLGSLLGAVALVALAVLAERGLHERERRVVAEAQQRRLETLALAGAGLAHRIRNPLAAIKGTAQLLTDQLSGAARERSARVVEASERIETILARLLQYARPPEAQPAALDLTALATALTEREGGVLLESAGAVFTWADPEHVESIIEELLANARAFDPTGPIELAVGVERGLALVEVRDRGPGLGIDSQRAFEPYVTTRADGTGLGLAIVRSLAQANRGEVELAPRGGGGCLARLRLPLGGNTGSGLRAPVPPPIQSLPKGEGGFSFAVGRGQR
ncbi:MAG: ATP-binding protein [Acidobacteriota bacterium]